jgi:hypothetical protein
MVNQTKNIIFYDIILLIEWLGLAIVTLYFVKKQENILLRSETVSEAETMKAR